MSATLHSLHIRNFAIIDELDIDFQTGFTVLSGETGAGKSILFDALGLVLGDRADSQTVRQGSKSAEISAEFKLAHLEAVQQWLDEQGLADEGNPDQLLLRRQIRANGQSRAFVNGVPSTIGNLKQLAEMLLDIHGQHAHQSLLKPSQQRRLLDAYGQLDAEVRALGTLYRQIGKIDASLAELSHAGQDTAQRMELLRYQLLELDELEPSNDDLLALEDEHRRLSGADNLLRQGAQASNLLYAGDASVYDQLQHALSALQEASAVDPRFATPLEMCEQAQIQIKEAAQSCEDLAADIEPDPMRLQTLSQRIDRYHELARKHRVKAEELPEHWQQLASELARLENQEQDEVQLKQEREKLIAAYDRASADLSAHRKKAAKGLGKAVTQTVQPLGLPHAQCEIAVHTQADAPPQAHGRDQVEFLITMNPGQAPAPLAKVASGGELARTSLAIQVVCLDQSPVPVLLFDEVDVGIGGGVAEVVGRRLKQLAQRYQVFCVTHQPQVAALADTHVLVQKQATSRSTSTQLLVLDEESRISELSRMLGGVKITEQTRSHASEMLNQAQALTLA